MLNFFIKKNPHTKNFQTKKKPKRNTDKCFSSGPGVRKPQFKVMQRGHRKLHPIPTQKSWSFPHGVRQASSSQPCTQFLTHGRHKMQVPGWSSTNMCCRWTPQQQQHGNSNAACPKKIQNIQADTQNQEVFFKTITYDRHLEKFLEESVQAIPLRSNGI